MMRIGISTASFYPETTERSLELAARAGARSAEVFVNAMREFSVPFFKRLSHIAGNCGVEIVSVHPFTSGVEPITFFSNYPRRFEDGLRLYRRFFELTARAGAPYFILHGASPHAQISPEEICARFAVLSDAAAQYGVTLLQENVSRCISASPQFIRLMRRELGDKAAFVLDTKQALRSGSSAAEMIDAMGGALRHIHISDYKTDKDCLPPGRGVLDFPALIASLRTQGYRGDLMIELYRDSYERESELHESYEYLRGLL